VYNEDSSEEYAFTLCVRPDGSYYGTADGNQCRKGTETSRDEREVTRSEFLSMYEKNIGGTVALGHSLSPENPEFQRLNDEEFANVTRTAASMITLKPAERIDVISLGEKRAIVENEKFLKRLEKDPTIMRERLRFVSENELDASWALLPTSWQKSLSASGVSDITALKEDGTLGKPSAWRGKQVLKRYLEQNGKDLFTGKRLSLLNAELEHIQSFDEVGAKRAERPDNWALIRQGVNRQKGNTNLREYVNQVKRTSDASTQQKFRDARTFARTSQNVRETKVEDAKNLAKAGYSIYKKYGDRRLHHIMTQLGIRTRYSETMKSGKKAGRPFLKNKLPNLKDPDGRKVSAQGWITLNWGNMTKDQQRKVQTFINTNVYPRIASGEMSKREAAVAMEKMFASL